jgi:hypothetical protein
LCTTHACTNPERWRSSLVVLATWPDDPKAAANVGQTTAGGGDTRLYRLRTAATPVRPPRSCATIAAAPDPWGERSARVDGTMKRQKTRASRAAHGPNHKPVNLALQGGGAHGAFAWGVLDKLAADGRLDIDAISATSAGAMNGVVFAYGIAVGGADGARQKLNDFWQAISTAGNLYGPVRSFPWEQWLQASGFGAELSPAYFAFQAMTHMFSPYQLNPLNFTH